METQIQLFLLADSDWVPGPLRESSPRGPSAFKPSPQALEAGHSLWDGSDDLLMGK